MEPLMDVWKLEWASYNLEPMFVYAFLAIAVVCASRDWQKTLLVIWGVVYAWSMMIALTPGQLDLEAGFLVIWMCAYGLSGFFFLGYLFYANLK